MSSREPRDAVLSGLLPACCASARCGPDFDPAPLVCAEELALVGPRAVEKRRRELLLGRAAAHLALHRAGLVERRPILRGVAGEPIWPAGWVGSITHSAGTALAAVAPASRMEGIGVDVEDLRREIGPEVREAICLPSERAWAEAGAAERFTRVFSAKESVYKALFPRHRAVLRFQDVSLEWSSGGDAFEATLLRGVGWHAPGARLCGRSALDGALVLSAVALPAHGDGG